MCQPAEACSFTLHAHSSAHASTRAAGPSCRVAPRSSSAPPGAQVIAGIPRPSLKPARPHGGFASSTSVSGAGTLQSRPQHPLQPCRAPSLRACDGSGGAVQEEELRRRRRQQQQQQQDHRQKQQEQEQRQKQQEQEQRQDWSQQSPVKGIRIPPSITRGSGTPETAHSRRPGRAAVPSLLRHRPKAPAPAETPQSAESAPPTPQAPETAKPDSRSQSGAAASGITTHTSRTTSGSSSSSSSSSSPLPSPSSGRKITASDTSAFAYASSAGATVPVPVPVAVPFQGLDGAMASLTHAGRLSSKGSTPADQHHHAMDTDLLLGSRQGSGRGEDSLHTTLLPAPAPEAVPGLLRVLGQIAVPCLGAYLFGYHLSVVNGPMDSIARDLGFAGSAVAKGSVVSSFLVGAFLGCSFSSTISDGLGRRRAFLATALPVLLGSSLSALSGSLPLLLAGRVLVGIGLGIGSPLPTMYISEISRPDLRGTLSCLPQVAACLGILAALAAGVHFPGVGGLEGGWRWCFWLGAVPAAALTFLSEQMTESPRWLAQKEQWGEAEKALASLQGPGQGSAAAVQHALLDLKSASASLSSSPEVSWSSLFSKEYSRLIFLGCALFGLQQLSGINSVFYFSSSIFRHAGVQSDVVANVSVGVVNLAASILSTALMDRAGRKTLLVGSFAAMGVSLTVQAGCSLLCSSVPALAWLGPPVALASTLMYVMAFAMGVGPVPGLLLPEIFPTQIRAKGFGLGLCVYWVFNCLLGLLFLPLLEAIGPVGISTFFASMCFLAVLFTQRYIIETKGKTLEEIETAMMHR